MFDLVMFFDLGYFNYFFTKPDTVHTGPGIPLPFPHVVGGLLLHVDHDALGEEDGGQAEVHAALRQLLLLREKRQKSAREVGVPRKNIYAFLQIA